MIYIVSLQYSPVYKSHCLALGNQLKNLDENVKYLFSSQYKWMLPENLDVEFVGNSRDIKSILLDFFNLKIRKKIKNAILQDKPEFVYLFNVHPFFNNYIAKLVKNYGGAVIQHIHEPYVENKKVYGGIQRYWLYLFEDLQDKILKNVDKVIISSDEAFKLFNMRYASFKGEIIKVPLIYENLGCREHLDRHYLNFIGPPVSAKGPETFLEIVSQLNNDEFLLISRAEIDDQKYFQYDNLEIFYQVKISDELLGRLMQESIMTITPYKTARQSSVASTAYMYGTPVLGANINGLKEIIKHKDTGYLVDLEANIDEWLEGLFYIKKNLNRLSKNCRECFLDKYSEENWPKYFEEVFEIES